MTQAVTTQTFQKEVLEADQNVVVDFWAPWCGPCRMMAPIVEDAAKIHKDVKFVSVDIDEEPELAQKYGIQSIPSFVAFSGGERKGTLMGAYPAPVFNSHVQNLVS